MFHLSTPKKLGLSPSSSYRLLDYFFKLSSHYQIQKKRRKPALYLTRFLQKTVNLK
nr:MAG TPA: hypothetical protein [Caudoviricetes sp.]